MTTVLALSDPQGILTDHLASQKEVAKCANCLQDLTGETFVICRAPDFVPEGAGTSSLPPHQAHTGCKKCVDDLAYIGLRGACQPCLRPFGSTRLGVKFAGVALRPPVKNTIATELIQNIVDGDRLEKVLTQQEENRIQEQAARRKGHVEEVQRRRYEEQEEADREAEEVRRTAKEEADREAEEVRRTAKEEADREAEEVRRAAKEEADRGARRCDVRQRRRPTARRRRCDGRRRRRPTASGGGATGGEGGGRPRAERRCDVWRRRRPTAKRRRCDVWRRRRRSPCDRLLRRK